MELSSYHTHTKLCKHAHGMPRDYLQEAKDFLQKENHTCLGFGFSDHCPYPNDGTDNWPEVRMTPEEAPNYIKAVREASKTVDFPVLAGFECEWDSVYKSWYKDFLLGELGADYLVLGSHWIPHEKERLYLPNEAKNTKLFIKWVNLTLEALDSGLFKIFAHPDLCFGGGLVWSKETESAFTDILSLCKDKNIPIEVNGYGILKNQITDDKGILRYQYPYEDFWHFAKSFGVKVVCNSDAHRSEDALYGAFLAREYANKLGIEPISHLN
ncbi:MAG: histidinol-phosphatase [Spirochaetaceae bacterium]|nr:histidinol-phosphatase [Spirochaetaceae bacterium]